MSLIIFLIVLGILVIVHEWGHFIAARLFGIEVEKFSIGFGPVILSRRIRGTDYLVSAIPLGGYVKLAGDERSECSGKAGEFFARPVWQRFIVVAMGPLVNFVFAYLCFVFLFFVTGYPIHGNQIGEVMEGYPAYEAGFLAGDRIVKIDGKEISRWVELQTIVFQSEGKPLDFTIVRNDTEVVIEDVAPVFENFEADGKQEKIPLVGLKPFLQKYGFIQSLGEAGRELWDVISMTGVTLYRIVIGAESVKDKLAGPIRIFDVVRDASQMGFSYLLFIMAVISASLGFFNLFPIPVLDGGHLLFFTIEGIRRKPLPQKVEEGFIRVGFSLIICLALVVFYNDIVAVGWADKISHFINQVFH
ncbi:MAG: RIP metalloprotease RseP [Candidatus Omnitrophota bacterium]